MWKIDIEQPLQKGYSLSFTDKYKMFCNRIMCHEDIVEIAKKNKHITELIIKLFRKISMPSKKWSWRITLPKKYPIRNPQPFVFRKKLRLKSLEVELEKENVVSVSTENNKTVLQLTLLNPITFLGYGFTWPPPLSDVYDKLCKENGITPFHGEIQN